MQSTVSQITNGQNHARSQSPFYLKHHPHPLASHPVMPHRRTSSGTDFNARTPRSQTLAYTQPPVDPQTFTSLPKGSPRYYSQRRSGQDTGSSKPKTPMDSRDRDSSAKFVNFSRPVSTMSTKRLFPSENANSSSRITTFFHRLSGGINWSTSKKMPKSHLTGIYEGIEDRAETRTPTRYVDMLWIWRA